MSRAMSRSRSTSARRVSSSWRPAASRPSAPWFAIVRRWSRSSRERSSSERLRPTARTPRSLPCVASGRTTPIPRRALRLDEPARREVEAAVVRLGQANGRATLEEPLEEDRAHRERLDARRGRCGVHERAVLGPREEELEPLEPQEIGRARGQELAQLRALELRDDRPAHLEERRLEVRAVPEKDAVHDALHAPPQRVEEEDDEEAEREREGR